MALVLDIHKACREGNLLTVAEVLTPDIGLLDSRNKDTMTPVMVAAQHGNGEVFDFLISKDCDLSKLDSNSNTVLHTACSGGHVHIVEDLLSRDMDCINSTGHYGKTPAMNAAEKGNREVFFLLLDKGCSLTLADRRRNSLLHWACYGGSVEIVEYLLSQDKVEIDVKGHNCITPVMIATRKGHRHVFDVLVTRGCDLFSCDFDMRNLLHHACHGGNEEIVEYLLSHDNIDINMKNRTGFTPVMVAASKGYGKIFYLLVSRECDLTGVNRLGDSILHQACIGGSVEIVDYLLLEGSVDINGRGQFGATPAMMAALKCRQDVFELLVMKGCNLTVKDSYNDSVLHHASRGGSAEIVELILTQGICDVDGTGKNGLTPIMIAAEKAHRGVFYLLLAEGYDLVGQTRLGDSILHCACIGGNVEIVEYLLTREGTDIDSRGQMGTTPVMVAAQKAKNEIFGILVDRGCDLTLKDNNNDCLLHHACTGGSLEIVSYLLSRGIFYINSAGQGGMTPVMMAVYSGQREVFDLLLQEHCDTTVLNAKHLSVLQIACLSGVVDIVEKLLSDSSGMSYRGGEHGRTPLMMAALKGHKLVFDLLVSKGCDLTTVDKDRNNVLHLSCIGGNVDIVDFILSRSIVGINSRGQYSRTAVMIAAENCRVDVFHLLLRRGCDLSLTDGSGNNVLHSASVGGSVEIVQFVLSQNMFNISDRGEQGKTAAKLALVNGHEDLAQFLDRQQHKSLRLSNQGKSRAPQKHHTE